MRIFRQSLPPRMNMKISVLGRYLVTALIQGLESYLQVCIIVDPFFKFIGLTFFIKTLTLHFVLHGVRSLTVYHLMM